MDPVRAVRDAVAEGKRAALVSVTRIEGEPPSREGMTFALIDGGAAHGTLGCDGFDRSAATDAARAIASGTRLERTYDWDEGSRIRVDVRPFAGGDAVPDSAAAPELLVIGGGPVARALVSLGKTLGFRVRVATRERGEDALGADEGVVVANAAGVADLAVGAETYVVVTGHDEEFSQPALRALLASSSPYLGMMGSRRHTGHLLDELRAAGHSAASLARVHSPVGLDIGAQNPEEVALAALAQIVAVRRGRTGAPLA